MIIPTTNKLNTLPRREAQRWLDVLGTTSKATSDRLFALAVKRHHLCLLNQTKHRQRGAAARGTLARAIRRNRVESQRLIRSIGG